MKKLLRVLGTILMIVNGIGFVSTLVIFPDALFSDDASFPLAAALLIMLAIFGGLFALGTRLRDGKPQLKAVKKQTRAKPRPPKRPEERAAGKKQTDSKERRQEEPLFPLPAEGGLCLYRKEDAAREAHDHIASVCGELRLTLWGGRPVVACTRYEGVEFGFGKVRVEESEERYPLPEELCASLTPASLRDWIERAPALRGQIDWEARAFFARLYPCCTRIRKCAGLELPDCVWPVEPPFRDLDQVGPDRLDNESGIALWLQVKQGTAPAELVPALSPYPAGCSLFLLTEEAADDRSLSEEERRLCARQQIRIGFPIARNRVHDLVSRRDYQARWEEWPGSADDAATFGSWWLEMLPPAVDTLLDEITAQILDDCRALGATDAQIRSLMQDGLCRQPNNTCSQLTYDSEHGEYVVLYWEKGGSMCTVAQADAEDFRFSFLQAYLFHVTSIWKTMRDPQNVADMLRRTAARFGHTASYQAAKAAYEDAFGPLDRLEASHDEFVHPVCPVLTGEAGKEHFFGELLMLCTDLYPLDHFTPEWADVVPSGRYVVLVAEWHSVYRHGQCVSENPHFAGTPCSPRWETPSAYKLYPGISVDFPDLWLQTRTANLTLEEAKKTAAALSHKLPFGICVARIIKGYDKW